MKTVLAAFLTLFAVGLFAQEIPSPAQRENPRADAAATLIVPGPGTHKGTARQDTSRNRKGAQAADYVPVDKEPVILKRAEPYYPELAVHAGLEGKVYVKIWVDTTGSPHNVQVVKSDHEIFNQPAISAAEQFLFTPALLKDRPTAVWVVVPFNFKLSKEASAAGWKGFSNQIDSVLNGDRSPAIRSAIHPDAKYIEGSSQLSLNEVLFGAEKGRLINDEKTRRHTQSPDSYWDGTGGVGYVIVTTENQKRAEKRIHSITVGKNSRGALQIFLWHVSK